MREDAKDQKTQNGNGIAGAFRIPAVLVIGAFIGALIALTAWAYTGFVRLEDKKADKNEVERMERSINASLAEIKANLQRLIDMHLQPPLPTTRPR